MFIRFILKRLLFFTCKLTQFSTVSIKVHWFVYIFWINFVIICGEKALITRKFNWIIALNATPFSLSIHLKDIINILIFKLILSHVRLTLILLIHLVMSPLLNRSVNYIGSYRLVYAILLLIFGLKFSLIIVYFGFRELIWRLLDHLFDATSQRWLLGLLNNIQEFGCFLTIYEFKILGWPVSGAIGIISNTINWLIWAYWGIVKSLRNGLYWSEKLILSYTYWKFAHFKINYKN